MTNRSPNLREKYLNAEKLFRKYYELGSSRSIYLLHEWAISEGMTSSKGTPPTPMGIWKAMWRWASMKENKETAFQIARESGYTGTWDDWVRDMINVKVPTAWQHPAKIKRQKFLIENGWIKNE